MARGRKTGGRKAGTPNKHEPGWRADARELALPYGPAAIEALARMAGLTDQPGSDNDTVRVHCLKELIDRAYGKAPQPLSGDADNPIKHIYCWADALPETMRPDAFRPIKVQWDDGNGRDHN